MVSIPPFRATVAEIAERIALVSVSGELDLHVDEELRDALKAAESLGVATVIVDLSAVSFMDSTVCGTLLAQAKRYRAERGELVIVANRDRAGRVLEVVGIDRVVHVHPTLHAAIQSLLLEPVP
jgi:anti-sigma B factor antagonist